MGAKASAWIGGSGLSYGGELDRGGMEGTGASRADVRKAADSRVDKPWGYELRWAVTDRYLGKVLHIDRGQALSLQYHEMKDECILLSRGVLDLELDGHVHRLLPGDTARIIPGTRHRMTAVEDCDIFEVSTPEIDDVVRLEDRYGRVAPTSDPASHRPA